MQCSSGDSKYTYKQSNMLRECIRVNSKRNVGIQLLWLLLLWSISTVAILLLSPFLVTKSRTMNTMISYDNYHQNGPIPIKMTENRNLNTLKEHRNARDMISGVNDGERADSSSLPRESSVQITERSENSAKEEIQLRIIILAYNRPKPLQCCLQALNEADYTGHRVHIEIHIDLSPIGSVDKKTYEVARKFTFNRTIEKSVYVHPKHVGLYGQWLTAWTPTSDSKEIALILEDDIAVSKYFYRWLYAAHVKYDKKTCVSGYSLANVDYLAMAQKKERISVSSNYTVYMYPILGSWGFSPHRDSWREFLKWFEATSRDQSFQPYVDGIRHTDWYKQAQSQNKSDTMWTMWHIYFTHIRHLYCVFPNILDRYMFAQNRKSPGLHFKTTLNEPPKLDKLVSEWDPNFVNMEDDPIKVDYYGRYSFLKVC